MGAPFGETDVELLQNQWNINVKSVEVNVQNGTSACGRWLVARPETQRFISGQLAWFLQKNAAWFYLSNLDSPSKSQAHKSVVQTFIGRMRQI